MWRHAVRECLEQGPETRAIRLEGHTKQLEHAVLHSRVVNAKAATTELVTIADDVVGVGANVVRRFFDKRHVLVERSSERMVGVGQLALVILFKEIRRVDPQKLPLVLPDQLPPAGDLLAYDSHHCLR